MQKKYLIGFIVLTVFTIIFLNNNSRAEEENPVYITAEEAVILSTDGDVKIKIANTDKWEDAAMGLALSPGDLLKTDDDSWVEVGFGTGMKNVLRVKEDAYVEFVDFEAGKEKKTGKIEAARDLMEQIKKGQEGTGEKKGQEEIERRVKN